MYGGRRGLAVPDSLSDLPDPVLIVEGASDTAACLTLGLSAVGRASNRSATHLAELLAGRKVLVVGENDKKPDGSWPGRDGAVAVANSLVKSWGKSVSWALPPECAKDIRDWLSQRGIDLDDEDSLRAAGQELLSLLQANAGITEARNEATGAVQETRKSQATILSELVDREGVELFHDQDGEVYVTLPVDDHRATHRVYSKGFKIWLQGLFFRSNSKAIRSQAVQDALGTIAAKALFEGAPHSVHVRVAELDGRVYLDLADQQWRAVEIDDKGWRIVADPPVKFRRPKGMLPLPEPVTGESVNELKEFVNVPDHGEFVLFVAWLVQALRPCGPYPLLVVNGEQGSAKSTLCRIARALVDPNSVPIRSAPREERDLLIAAENGWITCLENISHVPLWLSDSLCRLSTGGGASTRELYTNSDEILFDIQRPALINGIGDIVTRSDLLDRSIRLTLPQIEVDRRLTEETVWAEFEKARPRILGALLDAAAAAIRSLSSVRLSNLPRLADFAIFVTAAESALPWEPGTFIKHYTGNCDEVHELALESSVVAPVLRAWLPMVDGKWEGMASELLDLLAKHDEGATRRKGWPKQANLLSAALRKIAPNLRAVGIPIRFGDRAGGTGKRLIKLGSAGRKATGPSHPVTPPSQENRPGGLGNDGCDDVTVCDGVLHTHSHDECEVGLI